MWFVGVDSFIGYTYVYDWSGKCICRLVTDIKLFNICVTNDDKELIALGWDDDYHLYCFDQSKVMSVW